MLEGLKLEELLEVVNSYIRENYSYNYADILDDCIVYHLENGDTKTIYINLEDEED